MSIRNYVDNAPAKTVPAGCNSSTTSIIVNSTSGLPTIPFTATLDRATASAEQVLVTAAVGTTLTVTRNHGGTGAFSHAAGCAFEHTVDAIDLREANTHVNATSGAHGVVGSLVGDTDAQTLTNKTLTSPTITGTGAASFGDVAADKVTATDRVDGYIKVQTFADNTAAGTAYAALDAAAPVEGDVAYFDTTSPIGTTGLFVSDGSNWFPAGLSVGTGAIASGTVSITPVANTPTSATVTFPTGRFGGHTPTVTVAINGTVPGTVITGCSVSGISNTGCTVWVTRTNTTATTISWIAVQ